eukprot:scaffold67729_cov70-Phaeocystis_antarctica.AAC.3
MLRWSTCINKHSTVTTGWWGPSLATGARLPLRARRAPRRRDPSWSSILAGSGQPLPRGAGCHLEPGRLRPLAPLGFCALSFRVHACSSCAGRSAASSREGSTRKAPRSCTPPEAERNRPRRDFQAIARWGRKGRAAEGGGSGAEGPRKASAPKWAARGGGGGAVAAVAAVAADLAATPTADDAGEALAVSSAAVTWAASAVSAASASSAAAAMGSGAVVWARRAARRWPLHRPGCCPLR